MPASSNEELPFNIARLAGKVTVILEALATGGSFLPAKNKSKFHFTTN